MPLSSAAYISPMTPHLLPTCLPARPDPLRIRLTFNFIVSVGSIALTPVTNPLAAPAEAPARICAARRIPPGIGTPAKWGGCRGSAPGDADLGKGCRVGDLKFAHRRRCWGCDSAIEVDRPWRS
ncbi:quinolinate phoshoribosyltransferase [Striga asiatica]|uniref:Quinolinate phoshoribosyltransferase n=1 Tax=Striga asiatica TaxID=4170 RepID=A0A5A7P6V7_STRAF|nr:quinolinate phoshoribosyltransferase [Striga asiatica]